MKKAAKKKSTRGRRIGLPEIERMFTSYLEDPRPNTIARKLGIAEKTVRRYIEIGEPKLGIKSFRERHSKMQRSQDFDRAKEQTADLKLVKSLISQVYRDLFKIDNAGNVVSLKSRPSIGDLDKLERLKYFLAGEPDSRSEIVMTEQTETAINTIIDVIQKVVKDQETRNKIADGLIAAFNSGESSRGAPGSSYAQ